MFVLPVLDLLDGVVVRGVAGRRETYRPVESRICSSADPLAVAESFRDRFGLERIYVADLDAILHQRPNFDTYRRLAAAGFVTLVDSGIRDLASGQLVLQAGAESVIAGLESTPSPDFLGELVQSCGAERVVFSLDLQAGQPLTGGVCWRDRSVLKIGELALDQGIRRLIVLDLAQVGIGNGLSTLDLCAQFRARAPHVELITGGGVRDAGDLKLLAKAHINGVLIASALHNGMLTREDLDSVTDRLILPQ